MFGNGQLARCQARKVALLRQSAANRQALAGVARTLEPVMAWVDLGVALARKARSALSALAPLLSFWQTGRQESPGFLGKITGAISLVRSLTTLWKSWR